MNKHKFELSSWGSFCNCGLYESDPVHIQEEGECGYCRQMNTPDWTGRKCKRHRGKTIFGKISYKEEVKEIEKLMFGFRTYQVGGLESQEKVPPGLIEVTDKVNEIIQAVNALTALQKK